MKTLVLANQKGGVGKTTLIVNLAHYFAKKKLKVAVVDIDAQANATFTLKDHKAQIVSSLFFQKKSLAFSEAQEGIMLFAADDYLLDVDSGKIAISSAAKCFQEKIILLAKKGFDVCLIDSMPAVGVRFYAVLFSCDYVVAPIELGTYSLRGVSLLMNVITNVMQHNSKIQFIGMIPNKVDGRNPRHKKALIQLRETYSQFVCPMTIGLRSSIEDTLVSGKPIWKNTKTAARQAAKELEMFSQYIYEKMFEGNNDAK